MGSLIVLESLFESCEKSCLPQTIPDRAWPAMFRLCLPKSQLPRPDWPGGWRITILAWKCP
eukprot:1806046-Prorocentrum_lima.AAC.1